MTSTATSACLLAAALGYALGSCLACGPGDVPELGPTVQVERAALERTVVATGTLEPDKQVEVRPRISGIVEQVHVEAGDSVAAGDKLVEIDRELTQVATEEARARLREARVELKFAKSALDRASKLHEGGTMPDQRHDDAEARYQRALAATASVQANLDRLEVQLRHASVVSPMAGRVLDVDIEEGSAVASVASVTGGTRLLTLANEGALHLEGLVDENEIAHVREGQAARIRTEAFGDRLFAGEVREISPIGERRQNVTYFEVEIVVTDDDGEVLRPRMSGDAEIIAEVIEGALFVPETALHYEGSQTYVERVTHNGDTPRSDRQIIETGVVDGDRVEVRSGLSEGDEVRVR